VGQGLPGDPAGQPPAYPSTGAPAAGPATAAAAPPAPDALEPDSGAQFPPDPAVETDPAAKEGFLSTRNGKLVLIGAAVASFLVIAGIVAALALTVLGFMGAKSTAVVVVPPAPGTAKVSTSSAGAPESSSAETISIAPIGNADVYTARDPFQPRIPLPAAPTTSSSNTTGSSDTTGSGGGSSTTTGTATDNNTLTLLSVSTVDGVRKGKFQIGSTIYVAGAGEQLGSTPWQVVSVGSNSAVVLYGDEQVTLVVGQEITK
jgi:hypothetical protein